MPLREDGSGKEEPDSKAENASRKRGIVARKWEDDATHVAAATVSRADAIVSWNLRHIVRLDKVRGYNETNEAFGYRALTIITPKEVAPDDNEEDQELQQDL